MSADGRLPCIRTPGGHRRFKVSDIRKLVTKRKQKLAVYTVRNADNVGEIAGSIPPEYGQPHLHITDTESEMTRPLAERRGFQLIARRVGEGRVHGFVVRDTRVVGGWRYAGILQVVRSLGMPCYVCNPDESFEFPPLTKLDSSG
jgi:hypothetical protein